MRLSGGLNMYSFGVGNEAFGRYGNEDSCYGRQVKYLDENGYDGDREYARRFFQKDDVLTVNEIYVGRSSSEVEFIEFPNKRFNTVMFEDMDGGNDDDE